MEKNGFYFSRKNTTYLTRLAMLTALSIVLNAFTILPNVSNTASLTYIPSFIAGIYMGPVAGAVVGFVGDLLGAIIAPKGPYLILLGIGSMLGGLIPGLIFKIKKINPYIKITIAFVLCFIICSMGFNTLALWLAYVKDKKTKTYFIYLLQRMPQIINTLVNLIIMLTIYRTKILDKVFYKQKRPEIKAVDDYSAKENTANDINV